MVRIVKPYLIAIIIGFQSLLLAQNDYVKIYQSAIKQAMYPATNTVDSSLIAITSGDTNLIWKSINNEMYLLVVTWKGGKYYPDSGAYNTSTWSPVWVTTAPELKTRMKKEKYKDQNLKKYPF